MKVGENTNSRWKRFYPFYKMNVGETAVVRFLPDADTENEFGFIRENLTHTLIVNGKKRVVPCLKMYGESCPCCEKSAVYYAQNDKETGLKYYRKKSYLASVLVMDSPFEIEDPHEVKIIDLGPKLYKIITAAFASGDLDDVPYSFDGGYNFRLTKSQQGEYANYDLSKFAPKQTALDQDTIDSLELVNISEFLQPRITREAMEALLLADETGSALDEGDSSTSSITGSVAKYISESNETVKPATEAPTSTPASAGSESDKLKDILSKIRGGTA